MSYVLNINKREQGAIWTTKDFNNIKGRLLSVNAEDRLVQAAMDRFDSVLVAGDNLGRVYIIHLQRNKFELLCTLGSCITALALAPGSILAATAASSTYCYHSLTGVERAMVKSPSSAITAISVHSDGTTALLSGLEQALIWSLVDFTVVRRLALARRVDILRVFYQPLIHNIATVFVDGSIFLWDADSCVHQKALGHPLRAIDISRDGRLVAAGTRKGLLQIYEPDSCDREELKVDLHPPSIRQLAFLPYDPALPEYNLVAVLSFCGTISIYHSLGRPVLHLKGCYTRMAVPTTGPHLLLVASSGALDLFDLGLLWKVKSEVPQPKKVTVKVAPRTSQLAKPKPPQMSLAKIKSVVQEFGELPEKYRLLCWSRLLRLPNNTEAFEVLASRVRHLPLDQALGSQYPVADLSVNKPFHRMVRLLTLWSPVLETVKYLPALVFPFVKLFPRSIMEVFEILLTLFNSWCQNWLVFHPAPPVHLLSLVENLLGHHDQILLAHFTSCGVSSQTYAWSLLQTGFSEVFARNHWAALWDHVFCHEPKFLLFLVLAFNMLSRNSLLRCSSPADFEAYFNQQSGLLVAQVASKALELQATTPVYLSPHLLVGCFTPLPTDTYPLFINFPHFGVDLDEERERIIQQELDLLQRRQTTLALEDAELRFHILHKPPTVHSAHPDILRFQEERSDRWQQDLRNLERMKRNLLEHMTWSKARMMQDGQRYDDVVMKNAQLLLQKNLLEQELYRLVRISGQPGGPLKSSVPLVVRHGTPITPRDTLEAENDNLIQQISEMQTHLNSIKGQRGKEPVQPPTSRVSSSYDGQYLDSLSRVLEARQALVQQRGQWPYSS